MRKRGIKKRRRRSEDYAAAEKRPTTNAQVLEKKIAALLVHE